ncbi:hypothetical protein [Beggiatoa leptomitoformis]|uniref:Uncharacterized protein n=1 Tax=Beggiatoa leptomitoformis TaxID=288004 RepID=A0A2N9YG20_9GAMM|nr:hypothetical protein [Beggiatoa leptomitoformis]ALG68346.1 hypothetical protein AL038_12290 [Beggiatoa leptomitoformis]AUI69335.1 hypothetical protein BLE401_11975 [Beggiatoa leptomitoformis]
MKPLAWLKLHLRCVISLSLAFWGGLLFADNHAVPPSVWQNASNTHYLNESKPTTWQTPVVTNNNPPPLYNPWQAQRTEEPRYRPLQTQEEIASVNPTEENRYRTPANTAIATSDYRTYQPIPSTSDTSAVNDYYPSMAGNGYPPANNRQLDNTVLNSASNSGYNPTVNDDTYLASYPTNGYPFITDKQADNPYLYSTNNNRYNPTAYNYPTTYPQSSASTYYMPALPAYMTSPFYGQSLESSGYNPAQTPLDNPLYQPSPYQGTLTPTYPLPPFYDNQQEQFSLPNTRLVVIPNSNVVPSYNPFTGDMIAPSQY